MTDQQIATTIFYAIFAFYALFGTLGKEGKGQVGVMLFACWVVSNAVFWALPFEARPSFLPILDVLFALSAAKAGKETGSKVPLLLIGLSVIALAANSAFSIAAIEQGGITPAQLYLYEVSLNIVFLLQCLITGSWGIADALGRLGRFFFLSARLRSHPEPLRTSDEGP